MFKRLFFLSGIIALVLACALMYFWYLPNHQSVAPSTIDQDEVISFDTDSTASVTPP